MNLMTMMMEGNGNSISSQIIHCRSDMRFSLQQSLFQGHLRYASFDTDFGVLIAEAEVNRSLDDSGSSSDSFCLSEWSQVCGLKD